MNWFPSSPADSSQPTPFGVGEQPHLSPEEEVTLKKLENSNLRERLATTQAIGPSVRQQTQSEVLNLVLLYREIGSNPFSVRRLPFNVMRDMMADPDVGFAFYYIKNPLISATWSIDSPDAMLASAVDAAFRPIHADTVEKFAMSMASGFQPLAKRFRIGKLNAKYRDKNSSEPNKELDAWTSKNVDPLLFDKMISLAPENCMPKWDEFGNFNGFMYSPVPIPNPLMVGVANIFGPQVLSGYPIPKEFAIWAVNETNENYGCSPPDEPVLTTEGYKNIGDLDEINDRLVSVSFGSGQRKIFRGKYRSTKGDTKPGYKFEKSVRNYSGDLIIIDTGYKKTRVTPNHKLTVKWDREASKYWCVYLMKRGNWWRIGTTRLQRDKGAACSGVGNRMSMEGATEGWILGVFETFRDARFHESLWSYEYKVPEWTFEAVGARDKRNSHEKNMRNMDLNKLWESINSETGAKRILVDRKLCIDYPMYKRSINHVGRTQAGWKNCWTIHAANLLPRLMQVPVDPIDKGPLPEWKTFSIRREHYNGPVVSLEVKPYHHYISNGIITQNSVFGNPRTRRAYRFWWSRWHRWALADRSYERKADPTTLVWYPTDTEAGLDPNDPNDNAPTVHSLRDKAIQLGRNVRSGSVVALPGEFMIGEDGKTLNQRKWDVKYLEGGENFSLLDQNFGALSEYILRSLFLPTQAFVDSTVSGQTSSQRYIGAQMGQIYQESQLLLSEQYDDYKNRYMIPQFVAANYPDKVDIPIKCVTRGYGKQDSETTKQLITLIGQKEPHKLPINIRKLLEEGGYPLITEAQEKEEKKSREEEVEKSQPPAMLPKKEGVQGYNVGVEKTETGEHIYFQPGEELNLSVTSPGFLDRLPKIPPYEDPTVRSAAMKMRKLMVDRYKKQISSFSKQIRDRAVLKLAQVEKQVPEKPGLGSGAAKVAAAGAISAWLAAQAVDFAPTLVTLRELTSKILGAAGRKELKLANLDPSLFSPESQSKWVDDYVEENLKGIDRTIRLEVENFLQNQLEENSHPDTVANAIEEHFSELPQTHADRVVRSQTREAYNKGVLQAAIDSGISQVLAHDASDGADLTTDIKCQKRNGNIYSPQEAMKEEEHANGTLWFSYLNTQNLSVEITDDFPVHLEVTERMPAAYDDSSETLYIRDRAKDSKEIYVLSLGERLRLR
jgi:hypothetical protein